MKDDYKQQSWYHTLSGADKEKIETLRAIELAQQPQAEQPRELSPEELKEKARFQWKDSLEAYFPTNDYESIEFKPEKITTKDGEKWWTALGVSKKASKNRTTISALSLSGQKSATFNRETGILLCSKDASFETCYELKQKLEKFFD